MVSELLSAAQLDDIPRLRYLLTEGIADITETDEHGNNALHIGVLNWKLAAVQFLVLEGGADIKAKNKDGRTALLIAARYGTITTAMWLIERGADIGDEHFAAGRPTPETVWDMVVEVMYMSLDKNHMKEVTALLRVMLLRSAPPTGLASRIAPEHARVVEEGARLRAGLPAYLVLRRALLDAHCPLIPPLLDLVYGYEIPTTTEELWATGLGAPP
jgi:hypothetical protein